MPQTTTTTPPGSGTSPADRPLRSGRLGLLAAMLAGGLLSCHPPMWRARARGSAARVQRLVLVGQAQGCQCTRTEVAKAMRALHVVLGARRDQMVTQLDWDKDRAQVQRYRRQRRFIALPALYFINARDQVVGLLEGEIKPRWIRPLLR